MRLFVAVELPGTWLAALSQLQADLRGRLGPASPRWVRPEGIHLTLKFIGAVTPAFRADVEGALERAVPEAPDLEIKGEGLGTFGDRGRPRVVWVGLSGDIPGVNELAERVDLSLHEIGLGREKRPLAPHLTLARVQESLDSSSAATLSAVIAGTAGPRLPAFRVHQVSLMQSHLGPGGARYERLAAFPRKATPQA